MGQKVWSKPTWAIMHLLAANCNDRKREVNKVKNLISHLATLLPCIVCKSHAMEYLKKNKFGRVKSKEELIHFMFRFHNNVKRDIHYPLAKPSVLNMYKNKNKRYIDRHLSDALFIIHRSTTHLPKQINLYIMRSRIINDIYNTIHLN
jgi:hypothetical protein